MMIYAITSIQEQQAFLIEHRAVVFYVEYGTDVSRNG